MTATDLAPPRLPARPLTLDDVAELSAADNLHRYELDEGNLVVMPPADLEHADLIIRIGTWLRINGYGDGRVLANPGVRIKADSSGRCPDLLVLAHRLPGATVWIDPGAVLLVVEIVSKGSGRLDRVTKPEEYAQVEIPQYWRVERRGETPTVHMYQLGAGEHGEPAYVHDRTVLLDTLLAGEPPALG